VSGLVCLSALDRSGVPERKEERSDRHRVTSHQTQGKTVGNPHPRTLLRAIRSLLTIDVPGMHRWPDEHCWSTLFSLLEQGRLFPSFLHKVDKRRELSAQRFLLFLQRSDSFSVHSEKHTGGERRMREAQNPRDSMGFEHKTHRKGAVLSIKTNRKEHKTRRKGTLPTMGNRHPTHHGEQAPYPPWEASLHTHRGRLGYILTQGG